MYLSARETREPRVIAINLLYTASVGFELDFQILKPPIFLTLVHSLIRHHEVF